ncbi:efflux RND transporter periplasmic adaptor subunit [Marinomonas mediterranea]|jgi:RND family efflux transporter, MFP subunit|uniref:Efflux transporter, RND family, MFP subunit n=1 Tax=Marinomonas mediterranea (strain ATCC 700492 / JCM 21426 / NBRC 103028 / MMB-1) TaxID=717774 RepID=F2K3W0_MARM1|nr:efflux RND transporter periplasmic adaptor subunit [Marinomonas mediterranea]ADZ90209.1 efflux transporter, RND family, MFP subunit [Marinomonas mediterranea MMB-1]WCN16407.1 efflux RND transporter periplasmic adaptor subunit [Marinomonas mediterranea MMB-1]
MLSKFKLISGALAVSLILVGCQESSTDKDAKVGSKAAPSAPKAVDVGVVQITPQSIELTSELPGRTKSSLVAEIRPQVGGIIERRFFEEGQTVQTGDVLYEIDDSTYVSSVKQAQASLESAKASYTSTKQTYERYKTLRKRNNVSQQNLDDAKVAYLEALANQKKAEAALESSQIDLEHTQITSPISGRVGISEVTVGALVTAAQSTTLTTVRSLDPIYVDLSQTSVDQLRVRNLLLQDDVTIGSQKVSLTLEDDSTYPYAGQLKAREINVDELTGSVTLRAEFPNPDGLLLPGMFVRGKINDIDHSKALLVPQQGVSRDLKGKPIAFVVNAQNKIEKRVLTTERALGNQWLVVKGINAGDQVVVEGTAKIRAGSLVKAVQLQMDKQSGAMVAVNEATSTQPQGE